MYGIPIKYLLIAAGLLVLLVGLGLHIRGDNKMRDQIISLQVDLRTSESNYSVCQQTNEDNSAKFDEQQASIDKFALEIEQAIERSENTALKMKSEREIYEKKSIKLRKQVQLAIAEDDCANSDIADPDVVRMLNDKIRAASSG